MDNFFQSGVLRSGKRLARQDITQMASNVRNAEIEPVITGIVPQPDHSSPDSVHGEVSGQIGGEEGRERETGRGSNHEGNEQGKGPNNQA